MLSVSLMPHQAATKAVAEPTRTSTQSPPQAAPPDIQGPCTFCCRTCRNIFGDTCAIVEHNLETQTMTLERAPGTFADDGDFQTILDRSQHDFGCTYAVLKCRVCKETVGKSYVTTKPPFDHLRGLCTFPTTKFFLYELSQMSPLAMAFHNDLLASTGGDLLANGPMAGGAQQQLVPSSTADEAILNGLYLEIAKKVCAFLVRDMSTLHGRRSTPSKRVRRHS